MKFLLIAVYLGHGLDVPRYETRPFTDKQQCQQLAARYVGQVYSGQARAFCLELKPRKGSPS